MHVWKKAILSVLCILVFVFTTSETALADSMDDMFKTEDPSNKSKVEKQYEKYDMSHYQLDTGDGGWFDFVNINEAIYGVANFLWQVNTWVVRLIILILTQAFSLDLMEPVLKYTKDLVKAVKGPTWDVFFKPVIIITALYALFNHLIAVRKHKSWEQLIVLVIVSGLATLAFAKPTEMLDTFNSISKEASGDVLSHAMPLAYDDVKTSDDGVIVAANGIWNNHVKYPWYILQYGSVKEGKKAKDALLKKAPMSDERSKLVEKEIDDGNKNLELQYNTIRLVLVCVFNFYTTMSLWIVVILSILMLAYQLSPMILISLTGIVFLVSLFPGMGLLTIQKWLQRLVNFVLHKVVISIFLSLYIIGQTIMFTALDGQIMLQLIAIFTVAIALFIERKRIKGMFSGAFAGNGHQAAASVEQPYNIGGRLRKYGGLAVGTMYAASKAKQGYENFKNNRINKKLKPDATALLKQKYLDEKNLAEQDALQKGLDPRYSDFVKAVDERSEKGLPLFTGSQIQAATDTLRDIKDQGGDIQAAFLPTGVNTDDPKEYAKHASEYQNMLEEKNGEFEEKRARNKRNANFALYNKLGKMPEKEEQELSDAVRERQDVARQMRNSKNNEDEATPVANKGYFAQLQNIKDNEYPQDEQQGVNLTKPDSGMREAGDTVKANGAILTYRGNNLNKFKPNSVAALQKDKDGSTQFSQPLYGEQRVKAISPANTRNEVTKDINNLNTHDRMKYINGVRNNKRAAYSQLKSLEKYHAAEMAGKMAEFKKQSPNEFKKINDLMKTSGKTSMELVEDAKQNYDNQKLKYNVVREKLNLNRNSGVLKVRNNNLNNFKPVTQEVVAQLESGVSDAVKQRQTAAKALRRNPPKSEFIIENPVTPLMPEKAVQQVKAEWDTNKLGKTPAQHINVMIEQGAGASKQLRQLKLYQEAENTGYVEQYRQKFGSSANEIEKLKRSTKLNTDQLIQRAEQLVKNNQTRVSAAQSVFNLTSKPKVEVKGKQVQVPTVREYVHQIIDMPKVSSKFEVKADEAYKQSIINDWNTNQKMGVQPEQYIKELAAEKRTHYGVFQTFKNASKHEADPVKKQEYAEQANKGRALYLDSKIRHSIASDLLGVERKQFKPNQKPNNN